MARRTFTVVDIVEIYVHWYAGRSKNQLAASLGVDRKTIRKYLAPAEASGMAPGGPPMSEADWGKLIKSWFPELARRRLNQVTWAEIEPHRDLVKGLLETTTVTTLHQRLRDEGKLAVSLSTFRRWVTENLPNESARSKVTVLRDDVEPGSEAQIDYGFLGQWINPSTGKRHRIWAFVMVLPCSRHMFVRPVVHMDQNAWTQSHVEAFRFFGGVPRRLVPDNLRTAVDRPDLYDPKINKSYAELATYYGTLVDPARAAKPKDKPIKERFFRTLGSRFSQHVVGWTGTGFAHRGLGVDKGPLYPINTLQDLAEQWVALDYQQTPYKGLRSPFTPGLVLSPNEMYAQLMPMTGYRPRPITAAEAREMLIPAWVKISDKGITIENRTYQSTDRRMRLLIEQRSGINEHNDRFKARYNPYHPEVAHLFDHLYTQEWIEVEFIYRDLLDDRWTQDLWERGTAAVADNGGRKDDQLAIVKAVRALRRSLRQGPGRAGKVAPKIPFQGLEVAVEPDPVVDPYAGVSIDIEAVTAYPALPIAGREIDRPPAPNDADAP
ncbi:IS21 family transposase [Streptomyces sp. NPDC004129]